jgi:hypothetical protein
MMALLLVAEKVRLKRPNATGQSRADIYKMNDFLATSRLTNIDLFMIDVPCILDWQIAARRSPSVD